MYEMFKKRQKQATSNLFLLLNFFAPPQTAALVCRTRSTLQYKQNSSGSIFKLIQVSFLLCQETADVRNVIKLNYTSRIKKETKPSQLIVEFNLFGKFLFAIAG